MVKYSLHAFFICLLATGCNFINPAEKTPTYIRIDSFQFNNPNPQVTGSSSRKITSAWVYFNNQTVGVFDIPGIIPVLADKVGQIQINAGVTFNGLKNYQVIYPFYSFDSFSITPSNGQVISYTPKVSYINAAQFRFIEDFEVGNKFIEADNSSTSDTSLIQVTKNTDASKVFEGNGSGYIFLTTDKPNSEVINNVDFYIPQGQAYLELNYKCSVDFAVGLEITGADGTVYTYYTAGAKASESWNKFYIGLQDILNTYSAYKPKSYRVMIKAVLPSEQTNGYVLLDNIKVVSF
jgi:hypothetical protein